MGRFNLTIIVKKGSSLGAILEVRVKNCPPGLGEPIYQKNRLRNIQGYYEH